jgi:hypothetical protein
MPAILKLPERITCAGGRKPFYARLLKSDHLQTTLIVAGVYFCPAGSVESFSDRNIFAREHGGHFRGLKKAAGCNGGGTATAGRD